MGEVSLHPCLVVLCGIPGSGKTYACQQLIQNASLKSIPNLHVCYDNIIERSSDLDEVSWKSRRTQVLQDIAIGFSKLSDPGDHSNSGHDGFRQPQQGCSKLSAEVTLTLTKGREAGRGALLVIDDNMFYRSMRYEYYKLARKFKCAFCQILMDTPLSEALRRNRHRSSNQVSEDTLVTMASRLEPPGDLGWEQYSLTLNPDWAEHGLESSVMTFIITSMANPVESAEISVEDEDLRSHDRKLSLSSMLHQCDVTLRRLVGEIMRSQPESRKKQIAQLSGRIKKDIFESIQKKDIQVPLSTYNGESMELYAFLKGLFDQKLQDARL